MKIGEWLKMAEELVMRSRKSWSGDKRLEEEKRPEKVLNTHSDRRQYLRRTPIHSSLPSLAYVPWLYKE